MLPLHRIDTNYKYEQKKTKTKIGHAREEQKAEMGAGGGGGGRSLSSSHGPTSRSSPVTHSLSSTEEKLGTNERVTREPNGKSKLPALETRCSLFATKYTEPEKEEVGFLIVIPAAVINF